MDSPLHRKPYTFYTITLNSQFIQQIFFWGAIYRSNKLQGDFVIESTGLISHGSPVNLEKVERRQIESNGKNCKYFPQVYSPRFKDRILSWIFSNGTSLWVQALMSSINAQITRVHVCHYRVSQHLCHSISQFFSGSPERRVSYKLIITLFLLFTSGLLWYIEGRLFVRSYAIVPHGRILQKNTPPL